MKDYIRTHFVSTIFAIVIAAGAGHFMIGMLRSQAADQRQEIGILMQTSEAGAGGSTPTLGQIGQHIGGVFHAIDDDIEG
jgi:hypothetical protein